MFKFAVFFLVALTTFVLADAQCSEPCAKYGAECRTCGTCNATCLDQKPICTEVCRVGCFCPTGMVYDCKGYCVKPSEC